MNSLKGRRIPRLFEICAIALLLLLLLENVFSALPSFQLQVPTSGRILYMSPLHIEGRNIRDSFDGVVYLRGAGKIHWDDDPTGWWSGQGKAWYDGYLNWNEAAVRYHLRTMHQLWGLNVVRFHTVADWWLKDMVTLKTYTGSYRNNLKRTFEIAQEEGMYVIMDLFSPVNGSWMYANGHGSPGLPFPPYTYPEAEAILSSKQAFVDYWASVARELKNYPNVLFELYNEPNAVEANAKGITTATARDDWFDAVQKAINAIRSAGANNIIIVQWHLCAVPYMGGEAPNAGDLSWIETYQLNDTTGNILYSTHLYRCYFNPVWYDGYDYNYTLAGMENIKAKYVVEELNKPLIIGEMGVNMWYEGIELERELAWAKNVLDISNQWGLSYSVWDWDVTDQWHLLSDTSLMIPPPSEWGQVLIDAVAQGGT